MKNLIILFLFLSSQLTYGFMSGIKPERDTQGEITISSAVIPLAPSSIKMNAGYVVLENTSDKDVIFSHFTSPVYDKVEIHKTVNVDGTARMEAVNELIVPAKGIVSLKPGGTHLMLIGPRREIAKGESILMIGQDKNEKRFMISFKVFDPRDLSTDSSSPHDHDHDHHGHNH